MHRAVHVGNLLPCGGALLSCVDKKVTKEATRGGTEVDPFETPAVSDPFSPDQNRPPRDLSRQDLVATLLLIVQYSVKFRFIALFEVCKGPLPLPLGEVPAGRRG